MQKYLQSGSVLDNMRSSFRKNKFYQGFSWKKSGQHLLIFPSYKLSFKQAKVQLYSDVDGVTIYQDSQKIASNVRSISVGPQMPGSYTYKVTGSDINEKKTVAVLPGNKNVAYFNSGTSSDSSADTAETNSSNKIWDSSKDDALASFMSSWEASMDQTYHKITPSDTGNFYGVKIPTATFKGGKTPFAVDSESNKQDVSWAGDGKEKEGAYNVVAIYDGYRNSGNEHFLYYFTIYNGSPLVLVCQQHSSNISGTLLFTETQNQDLRSGFSEIVNEKDI